MDAFHRAYRDLNPEQKRAVDTIDGPVMVIAGPGTGKTQVLALRIAHILDSTDTPADGILCLTFTNAGVKAMRERLVRLIGPTATRVKVATFHAFGLELIETYYETLGFDTTPTLLDDAQSIALFNEILFMKEWEYLRPRSNPGMFYADLKSLIGTLKRDGVSAADFAIAVEVDITRIENDPDSISSRGASKGELKKDAQKRIDSLLRTREAAEFYALYESTKVSRTMMDYNDVLTYMVRIATESDDVRDTIRERFLYVLIDEHQDSSGVQNAFLEAIWKDVEQPNLFVVGDDRQLIYGFGGASLAYFEGFKHTFGTATRITLTHNYRSTQTILDTAEQLLQSSLAQGKLVGSDSASHPITLVTCDYPRDEIIVCAQDIKARIADGLDPTNYALLVPKNKHVTTAVTVLRDMQIPVASVGAQTLFGVADTHTLLTILRIIADPHNAVAIAQSITDPVIAIPALVAHEYLYNADTRTLSVSALIGSDIPSINAWGTQLHTWIQSSRDVYELIQLVGEIVLLNTATDDEMLRRRVEIIRTLLHLALARNERTTKQTLNEYIASIDQLIAYGEDIPLAVFGKRDGVQVLTLHGSKGLEFDSVWIAHMDERSLMSTKRGGFVLPQTIDTRAQEAIEDVAKRQLYVAITRAKTSCTISYALESHSGASQTLASIIAALPQGLLEQRVFVQPDEVRSFVTHTPENVQVQPQALIDSVRELYPQKKISVTMLNNFFECPWKWYFRNFLQLPEALTDSLHVGNVVHKTIEYILHKQTTDRSTHAVTAEIERYALLEARYDTALATRLTHHVQKIVDRWMAQYAPTIVMPYDTEKNVSYHDPDFAHLTITGKIDLVEEVITGEVRVTDWKTGSPKSNADIDSADAAGRMSGLLRQLAMYSYLIDGHSHGNLAVVESRLVFLEAVSGDKHAVQSRTITSTEIERLRDDIRTYDALMQSGEWTKQPCLSKHYNNEDHCSYCARAQAIYMRNTQE